MSYNGWTNYATWRVNLELFDGFEAEGYPLDVYGLSEALRDYAEEMISIDGEGLALDYALAFLGDVNFTEIAQSVLDNMEDD